MQTILGANGQIAEELARELHARYTQSIRLVSRTPRRIHESNELLAANLMDPTATADAVRGSEIAYLTVGLPMDHRLWEAQFPVMMRNVIEACKRHDCKLVFFDNTYMYARTAEPQTEESRFAPRGPKSVVRARMAEMLLEEMGKGAIQAAICRAPEFYGPGKTQSVTNSFVFDNIRRSKRPRVPLSDKTLRTLIWTPDASRATALIGNTADAYGQTWHLPCDDNRLTYRQLIELAGTICGGRLDGSVLKMWVFQLGGLFVRPLKELQELLPRYACDNLFVSQKFKSRFPDFQVTTYRAGVEAILGRSAQRP